MTDDFFQELKDRFQRYKETSKLGDWLDNNFERTQSFISDRAQSVIFGGMDDAFGWNSSLVDRHMYRVITTVAVINASLAALPGKMGVGVLISMGLEAVMAISIARSVGIEIEKPRDILAYFGLFSGVVLMVLEGFGHVVRGFFSLFSAIPGNPLVLAEIFATNLVGVLFIVGFMEIKNGKSFRIPVRLLKTVMNEVVALTKFQAVALKDTLSPSNLKRIYKSFTEWLKGDDVPDPKHVRGNIFTPLAMSMLIAGNYQQLEGPMGQAFLQAIRLRWSSQFDPDASVEEIAARFEDYDADALPGAINTIKGKMFEILATDTENSDSDAWTARMHSDETYPGSDIVFTNPETGQQLDVSLKAVSVQNRDIIEEALLKYPDISIMATDEVAATFDGDPRVIGSGFTHKDLQNITEENIDKLINQIEPLNATEIVFNGQVVGTFAVLWPITMAFVRKRITKDQYSEAAIAALGQNGKVMAARVIAAVAMGPVYAWFLLANGLNGLVDLVWEEEPNHSPPLTSRVVKNNSHS